MVGPFLSLEGKIFAEFSASDADLDLDPVPAVSNVPELSETAKDFIIGCLAIDPSARTGAQ